MEKRYFTLDEANRMVPRLQDAFDRLLQLRTQMRSLYTRLERSGFAPDEEDFPISVEGAGPTVLHDRATLKALMSTFREELQELEAEGCQIKGVEPGLVDWYARRGGRDVFLCWRFGEDEISWWHEIDAGFAGRRPIEEFFAEDDDEGEADEGDESAASGDGS